MPRTPARVTQADIARALRAAQAAGGVWSVVLLPDGTIRLTQEPVQPAQAAPTPPRREIVL